MALGGARRAGGGGQKQETKQEGPVPRDSHLPGTAQMWLLFLLFQDVEGLSSLLLNKMKQVHFVIYFILIFIG